MLIGELAGLTGTTTSAIRYYEGLGLIEPIGRESGRRLFGEGTPSRLKARIERLQAVAQTLRDSLDCGCQAWDRCPIVVS
jgi:DNA-binding transcriptional MerR regulator